MRVLLKAAIWTQRMQLLEDWSLFVRFVRCKFNKSQNKILPIKVRKIDINAIEVGPGGCLEVCLYGWSLLIGSEIREKVMTERLSSLEVMFELLSHGPERVKTC